MVLISMGNDCNNAFVVIIHLSCLVVVLRVVLVVIRVTTVLGRLSLNHIWAEDLGQVNVLSLTQVIVGGRTLVEILFNVVLS